VKTPVAIKQAAGINWVSAEIPKWTLVLADVAMCREGDAVLKLPIFIQKLDPYYVPNDNI